MNKIYHYCGHIISPNEKGRFAKSHEDLAKKTIKKFLKKKKLKSCFGSLASGADNMLAEAMIAKGADLHLVLPFDETDFIEMSVAYSGKKWVERFHKLIKKAKNITQIFLIKPYDYEVAFALCTEVAMGLSLLDYYHNNEKQHKLSQLCIWDEQKTKAIAGTYIDILRWQKLDLKSKYINSKHPDNLNKYKPEKGVDFEFIQPLNIVIYDLENKNLKIPIKSLTDLDNYIDLGLGFHNKNIDFNHELFGKQEVKNGDIITRRALAHIAYHCHIENKSQIITHLIDEIMLYA